MGDKESDNKRKEMKLQKSYFDVLGICCSSEVPLVEKILQLEGIHRVTVVVPSRTVIVVHDPNLISQLQIVKALNQARLEASIRVYGTTSNIVKKWPSPYILACGVLLLASLFKRFFSPLQWLAVAAAIVGLPPIIFRSIAAVRRFTLDINILMVIAVAGSVALKDYLEAGFIVFLFTIAEWLESRASHKATAGMASLMSMAPQKAILAETGEVVDAQNVNIGVILAVKAGEVIPIDGIVVDGRSEVDESSLTGETFPVPKQVESVVWAGTLNLDGYISVRTTALAENSAVAKMARLVEEAQNSRSKTQRLIDSCAKYYTPAVVVIAAAIAVIPLILKAHNRKHWFQLALVLLVSACPCALVLSTPVATFCALLNAARIGLLIKGGDVLEILASTKVVALDKTGTITMGEFSIREFRPINHEVVLDKLLYWVSSIESKSGHPMASALVDYARSHSIEPKPEDVSEFHIYPGEGIHGEIDGKNIYVGNKRIAARAKCKTVPNVEDMKEAATVGYVFAGAKPVGIFTLSDTCRTGAAEAIRDLKSLGVMTAMLTGDSTAAAMHAQNQLGNAIEMVHAELLPEDKVRIISDLKTKEGTTVMVGDGLNDAPALAMANVGISMGISGSAVAMETSHITLMSNDIRKILKVIQLAKKTHHKIIVNMFLSMVTKLAILALAIAGHPLLWAAVLADVGTCLVVILNSMMLLPTRTTKEKKCCGSSHKSEGNCCGSLHKSQAHKPACGDHCTEGKCGSAGACKPNCSSDSHGHGCHDHGTEEEEKSHHSCSGTHKKENCHLACSKTSHCESSHKSQAHCSGSLCKSHTHSVDSSHQSHAHCSGSSHKSHAHSGGSSHQSQAHCSDSSHKSHEHSTGSSHQSHGHCSGSSHKSHAHSGGSSHQSHAHCSGSSHKSHEHKHAYEDHCAKGTCGSAGASGQSNCASLHEHSCHDHETAKEGRSHHNCSRTHKEEEHHMDSPNHLHSDPQPVAHVTNVCHEHLISITNTAEHNSDGLHKEHSDRHIACCNKEDVTKECSSNATCGHHPRKTAEKKEVGGCCKSERKECGSKDGCKKEDYHTEAPEHSHNNRELILHALNASHEHLISMPSEAEHHQKHSVGHNSCCHKPETAKDCHSTEKKEMSGCCRSEREKREIGGCGKSYRKQCERQKSCCGGGMVQMPEIIIAD